MSKDKKVTPGKRHAVKPPVLPLHPEAAKCPKCGKGGHGDMTTIRYQDAYTSKWWISCGYCGADAKEENL